MWPRAGFIHIYRWSMWKTRPPTPPLCVGKDSLPLAASCWLLALADFMRPAASVLREFAAQVRGAWTSARAVGAAPMSVRGVQPAYKTLTALVRWPRSPSRVCGLFELYQYEVV